MFTETQLRGYLLEETLAWLLQDSGYALLTSREDDPDELLGETGNLRVKGRGTSHQADVLGQFAFTPAFSLPVRLFLEAKFRGNRTGLDAVRNAFGVIQDVNENYMPDLRSARPRRRFQYRYALFSASGFSHPAQDFALAHQISLVDLSGQSFAALLEAVRVAAQHLYRSQRGAAQPARLTLRQLRAELRSRLDTAPGVSLDHFEDSSHFPRVPQPEDDEGPAATEEVPPRTSEVEILDEFAHDSRMRDSVSLLLAFPAAPFIVPMATTDKAGFLRYADQHPSHRIRLRRVDHGSSREWIVSAAHDQDAYELRCTLPDALENWISDNEERQPQRIWTIKTGFLANIMIYYRAEDGGVRACQLRYEPGELRRA